MQNMLVTSDKIIISFLLLKNTKIRHINIKSLEKKFHESYAIILHYYHFNVYYDKYNYTIRAAARFFINSVLLSADKKNHLTFKQKLTVNMLKLQ